MSDRWRVELGDCLAVLERMEADSVDAVVTDPPYGLEFMGAEWDKPWAVRSEVPVGFAGREGTSLPSHRDGRNPTCRTCGGRGRGATRCACPTPEWDRSPAQDMRDFQAWSEVWLRAVWRVLKPGGHLLAFGGTRTAHRLACAAEDAGFEIRDRVLTLNGHVLGPEVDWIYGTGWPKSMNVGKAIDAAAGVEREVVGSKIGQPGYSLAPSKGATVYGAGMGGTGDPEREAEITAPATPEAEQWEGWGTALKPAHEPIVVARKPFRGTVISNVLERGTGALNIDACRIATGAEQLAAPRSDPSRRRGVVGAELQAPSDAERNADAQAASIERANRLGRWPANVALIHAAGCQRVGVRRVAAATTVRRNAEAGTTNGRIFEKGAMTGDDVTYGDGDGMETVEAWECEPGCPVAQLDALAGDLRSGDPTAVGDPARRNGQNAYMGESRAAGTPIVGYGDRGSASRFFAGFHASADEGTVGTCDSASATAAASTSGHDGEPAVSAPSPAPPAPSRATSCPAPSTSATPSASRPQPAGATPTTPSTAAGFLRDLQRARRSPTPSPARRAEHPTPTDTTTTTPSRSSSAGCAEAATSASTPPSSGAGAAACGPSRVFYSGKASPAERDAGLNDLPLRPSGKHEDDAYWQTDGHGNQRRDNKTSARNFHPTVKPIDLMRWLIRLVAPPGALVLDPFGGSGSTVCAGLLEGVRVVAVEREENFAAIARTRAAFWASWPIGTPTERVVAQENARRGRTVEQQERRAAAEAAGQLDLLATPEEPDG